MKKQYKDQLIMKPAPEPNPPYEWVINPPLGDEKAVSDLAEICIHILWENFAAHTYNDRKVRKNRMQEHLLSCSYLALLKDARGTIVGFYLADSIPVLPLETYIHYSDATALVPSIRGKGIYQRAERAAWDSYRQQGIPLGYLACRTQNPFAYTRFRRMSNHVFPFDEPYDTPVGRPLLETLTQYLQSRGMVEKIDPHTGIQYGVYGQQLGNSRKNGKHTLARVKRLIDGGFQSEHGDAVIIAARIDNPARIGPATIV